MTASASALALSLALSLRTSSAAISFSASASGTSPSRNASTSTSSQPRSVRSGPMIAPGLAAKIFLSTASPKPVNPFLRQPISPPRFLVRSSAESSLASVAKGVPALILASAFSSLMRAASACSAGICLGASTTMWRSLAWRSRFL